MEHHVTVHNDDLNKDGVFKIKDGIDESHSKINWYFKNRSTLCSVLETY